MATWYISEEKVPVTLSPVAFSMRRLRPNATASNTFRCSLGRTGTTGMSSMKSRCFTGFLTKR